MSTNTPQLPYSVCEPLHLESTLFSQDPFCKYNVSLSLAEGQDRSTGQLNAPFVSRGYSQNRLSPFNPCIPHIPTTGMPRLDLTRRRTWIPLAALRILTCSFHPEYLRGIPGMPAQGMEPTHEGPPWEYSSHESTGCRQSSNSAFSELPFGPLLLESSFRNPCLAHRPTTASKSIHIWDSIHS